MAGVSRMLAVSRYQMSGVSYELVSEFILTNMMKQMFLHMKCS